MFRKVLYTPYVNNNNDRDDRERERVPDGEGVITKSSNSRSEEFAEKS